LINGRGVALLAIGILAGPLLGGCNREETSHATNFGGDARRGADVISKYGCGNCHDIPKIANADGNVGPPLIHVGKRTYLAGFVRNSPDNWRSEYEVRNVFCRETQCRIWASRKRKLEIWHRFCTT
jgi:hypothetical protein